MSVVDKESGNGRRGDSGKRVVEDFGSRSFWILDCGFE